MFDFGFSELVMIGIVALVVLGPERLPVVARTAGQWLGKAQRMVQQVKSDIEREAELSELKKIQEEAQGVADNLTKTIKGEAEEIEKSVKDLQSDVNAAAGEMTKEFNEATKSPITADLEAKSDASDGLASAFDSAKDSAIADNASETASSVDDFYGWYGSDEAENDAVLSADEHCAPSAAAQPRIPPSSALLLFQRCGSLNRQYVWVHRVYLIPRQPTPRM